jgi:hypothetical protein
VTHLLLIFLVMMRQHVDDKHPSRRPAHPGNLGKRPRGVWRIVQHQGQQCCIELAVVDGQRLELTLTKIEVRWIGVPRSGLRKAWLGVLRRVARRSVGAT